MKVNVVRVWGRKRENAPGGSPGEVRWGWGFPWGKGHQQCFHIQDTDSKESLLSTHFALRARSRLMLRKY